MKVLMISTDMALVGARVSTGDALERHRDYGKYVDKLDIVVLSTRGFLKSELGPNVFCYPTNSKGKWSQARDGYKIGRQLCEEEKYDLVVCQDPFLTGLIGIYLKKKFALKLLVHFHGDFWKNKFWLRENYWRIILLLLSKIVVKRADFIRVVAQGIKDKMIKSGVDGDKIRVISTPVDLERFRNVDCQTVAEIRREFKNRKIVLWVGKMRKEKNLNFLLKVFKQILAVNNNVVLVLAGDGNDFENVNKLRLRIGLGQSVIMKGHVPYSVLVNYFHATDIIVLPSRHESLGKVLIEAGAAAKPAVASQTVGASEIIIHGKSGFLFPINNAKKFQEYVVRLLKNDDLAKTMGKRANVLVNEKFNYNENVKEVVQYWHEIESGFLVESV